MKLITIVMLLLLIPAVFAQNETNTTEEEFVPVDTSILEIEDLRTEILLLQDEIDELRESALTRSDVLSMIQQNTPDEVQLRNTLEEQLAPPSRFPIYSLIFILFLGVIALSGYIFRNQLSPILEKLPIKVKPKNIRHGPQFDALVNYIKENKGTPGLKQKLLSQGWKPQEVREALKQA